MSRPCTPLSTWDGAGHPHRRSPGSGGTAATQDHVEQVDHTPKDRVSVILRGLLNKATSRITSNDRTSASATTTNATPPARARSAHAAFEAVTPHHPRSGWA